jgi:hypothetical protein
MLARIGKYLSIAVVACAAVVGLRYLQTTVRAQSPSTTLNVVVLCASCVLPGTAVTIENVGTSLLDQSTGDIWFYKGNSPLGTPPTYVGKMTRVGDAIRAR